MSRNATHRIFTKAFRDEQKAAQKEHDKVARERSVWGVFQHSSGPSGGFVAREGYKRDDGGYTWPSPYTAPVKTFARKSDAEKDAHRRTYT